MVPADDASTPPGAQTYVTEIDPDERPTEAVVAAVAEFAGSAPERLDPLYDAVEPDALDAFFDHAGRTDVPQRLTFAYAGFEVTVEGDGTLLVSREPTAVGRGR